jgi:TolB-like protein
MPSLIVGYNYDIFISYRQKDNKGDRWVSEFVNALKTELESTFKEEISVYFDINPHDGLLETHDVDESLKEKLKCLVFIPIISRTYCDPKSFAWEHEFKAFVEQASQDQYGLKVKLPNGNVASRVLPVQIHDLDKEDITMCESVIGSVLRGIEFIYKEAGVDKPLAQDDDEKKNLNNTKYRIQIVKVAHAIKEIISAIRHYNPQKEEASQEIIDSESVPLHVPHKSKKTPIIVTSIIALALITLGILLIPKLFKPSEEIEKSIAVLPFKNDSPDQERMYFINGTMEAILDNLCKIKDLRVPGRSSVEQYRDNLKPIPTIAKELDVNYILEGSGHRDGNNVRLFVQLLDGRKDKHLWSKTYDADISEIFLMQSEIAKLVAEEIEAIITPEETQIIEKIPTSNLTAYDFYQRGMEEFNNGNLNRAKNLYNEALDYDSSFALAYVGLANVYWNNNYWKEYYTDSFLDSAMILIDKAISFDSELSEAYVLRGQYYYVVGQLENAIEALNKALRLNPNNWRSYSELGDIYSDNDYIKSIENYQKAISLNKEPNGLPGLLKSLAGVFWNAGFNDKCNAYILDALKLDGDSISFYNWLMQDELFKGNFAQSLAYGKKAYSLDSTNRRTLEYLGDNYAMLGYKEEALFYTTKFLYRLKELGVLRINDMHRVAYYYWLNGKEDEANHYFDLQMEYCTQDIELNRPNAVQKYSYYDLAGIYASRGETQKALENLKVFDQRQVMVYWITMFIKTDYLFNNIRNEPEFKQIVRDVEVKYEAEHERVRKWLEEQGML